MSKSIFHSFLLVTILSFTAVANASLIINGSFEDLTFNDNTNVIGSVKGMTLDAFDKKRKAWEVFQQIPGWQTVHGTGLELQRNIVTKSQHGINHIELDSHPKNASNSVIAQIVDDLIIGDKYLLEFFYKPRTRRENDNGINAFWFNAEEEFNIGKDAVFSIDLTKRQSHKWTKQSVLLTAGANSMNLGFGAFGKQNTLGGLIDNVSLTHFSNQSAATAPTAVPEPSAIILFMGAVLLIVVTRKGNLKA